jgi:protease-4
MAGKRHPIFLVLGILGVIALFLVMTMFIVTKMAGPSSSLSFTEKIGVITIDGAILDSRPILSQLVEFKRNKAIKAIILRINSPGGGVGASQEIYHEVRRTTKTKVVVASMGGVAASGGYYIAAAANKIVANPGTITGSIGVIMEFVRFEELLRKIGVSLEVLKSGEFKDIGSPHRPLTERDKELIQGLIEDIQSQFVQAVSQGRNLPEESVQKIADGRILSGAQAKKHGLVDTLGNFEDAVTAAKKLAGIEGDVTLVHPKKRGLNFWDLLFESAARTAAKWMFGLKSQIAYRWRGFVIDAPNESY